MERQQFLVRPGQTSATFGALPVALYAEVRSHASAHLHLWGCRIANGHYYDARAVEVFRHGRKLGHLSRLNGTTATSLLERIHALRTEIVGPDGPNEELAPVRLRVWVEPDARPS